MKSVPTPARKQVSNSAQAIIAAGGTDGAEALLRLPTVMARTGMSRSAVFQLAKAGRFPASVPLYGNTVAWIASEVNAWVQERIRTRVAEPSTRRDVKASLAASRGAR